MGFPAKGPTLAVETAGELGYAEQFLGPPGYKTAFIGHGVGLDLVEPPIVARGKMERLEAGMVLAIEPKMVFENRFCAGIESMVAVTETGCRLLSRVPEEIFIWLMRSQSVLKKYILKSWSEPSHICGRKNHQNT